jgi:hypothetical protein
MEGKTREAGRAKKEELVLSKTIYQCMNYLLSSFRLYRRVRKNRSGLSVRNVNYLDLMMQNQLGSRLTQRSNIL